MISGKPTRREVLVALMIAALALGVGCRAPGTEPWPDTGYQGPCPDGFVYIPAGTFEMGINPDDDLHGYNIQLFWDMTPRRTVMLSDYCIQKTEVTVDAFRTCVQSGTCTGEYKDRTYFDRCNYHYNPDDMRGQHPMNCVSWTAARQFCQQWEGGDLPSDAQWEKAARGTDARLFPWGNEPLSCDRANWDYDGPYNEDANRGDNLGCLTPTSPATWPVGTIEHKGDSPYGLKDMAGNVAELVLNCFTDVRVTCGDVPCVDPVTICDDGNPATRGGSAQDFVLGIFTVAGHAQAILGPTTGFRCVVLPQSNRRTIEGRR